jgi:hypothetical protein
MGFLVSIFRSAERVVALMQNPVVIKKSTFFSILAFFALILSSCAMPAGDPREVKNKAYSELSPELPLDQAPATPVINDKVANTIFSSDAFAAVRSSIGGAQLNELATKYQSL